MTIEEARQILVRDTSSEDGTYVRLRLGEDPGDQRVLALRRALRVLWRELSPSENLPRDIAFACGSILNFADECLHNRREQGSGGTGTYSPIEMKIFDIVQGAFDVLAGTQANTWIVPRPDLDEVGAET